MIRIAQIEARMQQWMHPLRLRLVRGEIRQLPRILWEGEDIESAAQGWYEGGLVLLVATNRRLLLIDHKWLDTKVDDFPYSRVSSVEHDSNVWMGKVTVSMPGGGVTVNRINSKNLEHFCQAVMAHVAPEQQEPAAAAQIGNLQILALMADKGLLSDTEFRRQWQNLLTTKSDSDSPDYRPYR
jgi:hypothetical protein